MVNGAPGSAWASVLVPSLDAGPQRLLVGAPAHDDPTPLSDDHLFDLASLTKVFTTVTALRAVEQDAVELDAPVGDVLGGDVTVSGVTLRELLTHSSGLPAESTLWRAGLTGSELLDGVLRTEPTTRPGAVHRYSDVGFIIVGALLERALDRPLDQLIGETADRLGATKLTFRPPADLAVATETQPHRGPVRGEVHDELAHALGAPAGHAGLFGTVGDVEALAVCLRDRGSGPAGRVLSAASVALMTEPVVRADDGYGQALGLRVRDRTWMGDIDAFGHTGFTGTCFAISRATGGYGVLLLNRVHPTRDGTDVSGVRRGFLAALGRPDRRAGAR